MNRNRHGRNRHHNNNGNRNDQNRNNNSNNNFQNNSEKNHGSNNNNQKKFHFISHENHEAIQQKQKAIQEFKARENICPKCGQAITDIASAMNDKASGKPMHFECAMEQVSAGEKLGSGEKIAYIGQGRFAVLFYENIRDQRHFQIKKIIEWEERDKKPEWRDEMSGLYSQVE